MDCRSGESVGVSQTCDQRCFSVLEMAGDWYKPVVPQCIIWLSVACPVGTQLMYYYVSQPL